ncbi:MAG: coenzyme F420-0:L-glutamate ligase [Candidatus Magasanikbacteria bacterium]|nr:coenzyme F420-0:L-glutamate ligase [Candidatus Magasanikbacteria bacterium]
MQVKALKTRLFLENENLVDFIIEHVPTLTDGSILVITSKIVALAEGRTVPTNDHATKEQYIKSESEFALETKYTWLTIKDGTVMAAAGIDASNANGKLILLPKDSFASAAKIRAKLLAHYQIKNLAVMITDSRTSPLRRGVTGMATGYAGFIGIKTYLDKTDIFERPFEYTNVNVPDSLAAAAVYEMGEGNEMQPLAIITETKIEFAENTDANEIKISLEDDMYAPLFKAL